MRYFIRFKEKITKPDFGITETHQENWDIFTMNNRDLKHKAALLAAMKADKPGEYTDIISFYKIGD